MQTYISILRGINVSGRNLIKMADLQQLLRESGFQNLKTYIQSGNVVYRYPQTDVKILSSLIASKITQAYGFQIPVITLAIDQIREIVGNNPFSQDKEKDEKFLHVTFLADVPLTEHVAKVTATDYSPDELTITGQAAYLYCPAGYAETRLSNKFLETSLKVSATTRNWKTTNQLKNMAEEIEKEMQAGSA